MLRRPRTCFPYGTNGPPSVNYLVFFFFDFFFAAGAPDFFFAFEDFFFPPDSGALSPKMLSQPATNFFEAPVCTVYPVMTLIPLPKQLPNFPTSFATASQPATQNALWQTHDPPYLRQAFSRLQRSRPFNERGSFPPERCRILGNDGRAVTLH